MNVYVNNRKTGEITKHEFCKTVENTGTVIWIDRGLDTEIILNDYDFVKATETD